MYILEYEVFLCCFFFTDGGEKRENTLHGHYLKLRLDIMNGAVNHRALFILKFKEI